MVFSSTIGYNLNKSFYPDFIEFKLIADRFGSIVKDMHPLKWITPQIAVGPAPHSQTDLEAIKTSGVKAILNLCAECYDLNEIESAAGFDVHWLPVADDEAPELDAAQTAVDWIDSILADQGKVLIHCRFGIGRTGTMATAWLLRQGYSFDDALELLSDTPAEPKSRRQWAFLDQFSRSMGKPGVAKPVELEKRRSRLGRFFRKYVLMNDWSRH